MRIMKNVRIISMLLALLVLAGAASCGGSADAPSGSDDTSASGSSSAVETTADPLAPPELPDEKYDGYEFRILTRVEGYGIYNNEHLVVEGENGEVLNDALYNRCRNVEELLDVKFTEIVTTGQVESEITKTVMAGDDSYDLTIIHDNPALGTEYLVDFNTLEYVNLDRPWWDQNYSAAVSMNGKLCTAVGSIMITHMDSVLAMFYNKKLAGDYKLPDLYELVRKGSWTMPKFFEITKDVTADLNGDGEYDDKDLYAFLGLDGISRLGSGVKVEYVKKDSDDVPTLDLGSEKLVDTLTTLREYAASYERDIYNPRTDRNTGGDGDRAVFRMFLNDQALFYVHGLGSAQMYRDMKSDFGVIPTPKLDETQESYFITPDATKRMGVPTTVTDLTRTSVILEALAYESYMNLRPSYYDTMLKYKYLRDDESIEMLDKYIYTNIGFTPSSGSKTLASMNNSILGGSDEIASTFASNKAAIEAEMEEYVKLFE